MSARLTHRQLARANWAKRQGHQANSCWRKVRFESKRAAKECQPHMEAYLCQYCAGWHLATKKHRESRRGRE